MLQEMCSIPKCLNPAAPGSTRCQRHIDSRNRETKRVKVSAFNAYGGCICACCSETILAMLTIDHIDSNGGAHRKELFGNSQRGGYEFYRWLKKHKYPKGYRVLCYNCNVGAYRNGGVCPHEKKEKRNMQDASDLRRWLENGHAQDEMDYNGKPIVKYVKDRSHVSGILTADNLAEELAKGNGSVLVRHGASMACA